MSRFSVLGWMLVLAAVAGAIWYAGYSFLDAQADHLVAQLHAAKPWPQASTTVRAEVGNFFSAQFGLPLAAVGAVIGAIITGIGIVFTSRQGDVDLLKFVEERLRPTTKNYGALTDRMGELAVIGNVSVTFVEELISLLPDSMADGEDLWETVTAVLAQPENARLHDLAEALAENLQRASREIGLALREIGRDPYAEAFRVAQLAQIPAERRPLPYLAARGIPANLLPERLISENTHVLAENLIEYSGSTSVGHYLGAYLVTPDRVTTQDHLGHAILPIILTLKQPRLVRGQMIEGYTFNVGCAYLLTLAAMLPTRKTIGEVFRDLFEGRARIAMRFLKLAGPDRDLLGSPFMMQGLMGLLAQPERLVIVRLAGGETQFYEPRRHGEIPTHGYVGERTRAERVEA